MTRCRAAEGLAGAEEVAGANTGVFPFSLPEETAGPATLTDAACGSTDTRFLVLHAVGELCERLQAIVAAGILAKDLGRVLVLLWRPDVSCNCAWQRLFAPPTWLVVHDPVAAECEEGHLSTAVELLSLWNMVCVASGHEDLLELALERFNRAHWAHSRAGRACFVDTNTSRWRDLPRFNAQPSDALPESSCMPCVCIRASSDFYPPWPASSSGLQERVAERALFLRGLRLTTTLEHRTWTLPPGTISVDAGSIESTTAGLQESDQDAAPGVLGADACLTLFEREMDAFANGLREVAPDVQFRQFLVAASSGVKLEERWGQQYGKRMALIKGRALNGSVPLAVEDALIGLVMLGSGAHILTDSSGPRLDVLSLLSLGHVEVVGSCADVGKVLGVMPQRHHSESHVHCVDPSTPIGPFFVVGSWDNWAELTELRPSASGHTGHYHARVKVKAGTTVEFQLLRDSDWGQRFFPTEEGLIWGPDSRNTTNWRVLVPPGCALLHLVWNPSGDRSLAWTFISSSGEEQQGTGQKLQGVPYFIAGSWDGWKEFTELSPGSAGGGPPYRSKIQVRQAPGKEEFQVFRGRDWRQRFHPSVWGSKICGPSSAEGENWSVNVPAGCKWLKVTWDPRGHRSLRWRFINHQDRVLEEQKSKQPEPDRPRFLTARTMLPKRVGNIDVPQRLGNWRLLSLLGRGYVGAVYRARPFCSAEDESYSDDPDADGEEVAVKFPCLQCEVKALMRLRNVAGVPNILDSGWGPSSNLFVAMPVMGPSLKAIMRCCDHDGLGGRVSWLAACAMGVRLVEALRGVHLCGLVHCDVNPGNVLFRLKDCQPQLIDFGWAREIGAAHFEKTIGTCMYNSIRAGFGGQRTPADDLESVGWLLLHCVLGCLPWAGRDEGVSVQDVEGWQRRSEGISVAKELFLGDQEIFGPEFQHCPTGLAAYIRLCQAAGPDPAAPVEYDGLVAPPSAVSVAVTGFCQRRRQGLLLKWPGFASSAGWEDFGAGTPERRKTKEAQREAGGHRCRPPLVSSLGGHAKPDALRCYWRRLVDAQSGLQSDAAATLYVALRGLLCWRPADTPMEGGTEKVCSVPRDFLIRTTGLECQCSHGGQWVQVDPVWSPKLPPALLEPNWLLIAKVRLPKIPWEDSVQLLAPGGAAPGGGPS